MPLPLPEVVRTYLAASTGDEVERVALCFAPDGAMHDESRTHVGPDAIGAWAKDAYERYRFALDVRNVEASGNDVAVTAQVSGSFPGSPIMLRYRFRLADGKIRRLDISPDKAGA